MVIIRSSLPINELSTFKSVVLPLPVPPHTIIFNLPLTAPSKKIAISLVKLPTLKKSSILVIFLLNLRIVITGPLTDNGGITALILDPSFNLESTIGLEESIVLPWGPINLWIVLIIWSSFINETLVSLTILPSISTYISFGPLTIISLILSSFNSSLNGPLPLISSSIKL